jgi:isopentenyl phosphate kinase
MNPPLLVFLKLGGSLITDKTSAHSARVDVIDRLAGEINASIAAHPDLRLVIGHGSGSFGHVPAKKYGTRGGVHSAAGWLGFAQVWREARSLNQLVIEALASAGLPVIAMPPSAGVTAMGGEIVRWDLEPLRAALSAGLIPVINGDTIFDQLRGGTILSTEELFLHLARQLHPRRILLAGIEDRVWADYPACQQGIAEITPANIDRIAPLLGSSAATDVTGGMRSKVETMLSLVRSLPTLEVLIFSGLQPDLVKKALAGSSPGTKISQG